MACGGFTCSRNALAFLNVIYILVAFILIGVAAYGKAVAIIVTLHVLGGIIACGVFLLLIALVGLVGAVKHHQVLLFFYMIILFLLFLVQFSVACACLALSDAQQQTLYEAGWKAAKPPSTLRAQTQAYFGCCGRDRDHQVADDDEFGHPSCRDIVSESSQKMCEKQDYACCLPTNSSSVYYNQTTTPAARAKCPLPDCYTVIEHKLHQAAKVAGGLGLFFAFTEIIGVWLAFRYRNQKDPRGNPSAFL